MKLGSTMSLTKSDIFTIQGMLLLVSTTVYSYLDYPQEESRRKQDSLILRITNDM